MLGQYLSENGLDILWRQVSLDFLYQVKEENIGDIHFNNVLVSVPFRSSIEWMGNTKERKNQNNETTKYTHCSQLRVGGGNYV